MVEPLAFFAVQTATTNGYLFRQRIAELDEKLG